ncbi:MAG: sugar transferase [Acidobacteria bacterium]|nr:sugar transferase [Acidobacteriota bacterium]
MGRVIEVVFSLAALIVAAPLLLAAMAAVSLESAGGPFYRARRVGLRGREFRMWKLRTMRTAAQGMGPITGHRDARVTRLGGVLRKCKVDELPQFLNVLAGEMTLVGPRPESPEIVARYTAEQRRILDVKPGITGKAQLISDDESETIPEQVDPLEYYIEHLMPRKVSVDLEYLSRRTAWTDVQILWGTAGLLLRALRRGGERPGVRASAIEGGAR